MKGSIYTILFLVGTLLYLGCSSTSSETNKPRVFHYNQHISITSLDPAFAKSQNNIWGVDHLFNGLVKLNAGLEVVPAIAHSWELGEDGKSYIFRLRGDVYFTDHEAFENGKGRKVVASDVVYSFSRILDPQVASPGSWIFKGRVAAQVPFEALNDSTFVLHLSSAFRPMLGILTMQYCSVVPREVVEFYGKAFRNHPIGTGPFKLKKWLEGQVLFLEKNQNYFGKDEKNESLPKLDAIRVSFMPDRKTAYLELLRGNIDYMSGLESSYANELITRDGSLRPHQARLFNYTKGPYLNTEYLGINLKLADSLANPLAEKLLRQALNFGLDREKMLRTLRNGVGRPAIAGFIPRGLPSYQPSKVKGYSYDPAKARALLREAGFPNGQGLPEIVLSTNKDYLDLCTFISRQWQELGVKVKIDLLDTGILRQMMRKGQVPFFRGSWIADYPDGESFLTVFYGKNAAPPNYTHFRNAKFDQLYEEALAENIDSLRMELYHEMDRILIEEAPVIFLFYDETALFSGKDIDGLQPNGINLLKVDRVMKSD